jgi:uncharacterized protein YwqG
VQSAVEFEVGMPALGGRHPTDSSDPSLQREATKWTLLAQIDSDKVAGMIWGMLECSTG